MYYMSQNEYIFLPLMCKQNTHIYFTTNTARKQFIFPYKTNIENYE